MSSGPWKIKGGKCYRGVIPTFEEFCALLIKMKMGGEDVFRKRYDRLITDLDKSLFRDYNRSSYDFLVKNGFQGRQKKLRPRYMKPRLSTPLLK